jgi:hypothetical protein
MDVFVPADWRGVSAGNRSALKSRLRHEIPVGGWNLSSDVPNPRAARPHDPIRIVIPSESAVADQSRDAAQAAGPRHAARLLSRRIEKRGLQFRVSRTW